MDPDTIFIILLYFTMLILTISSIIGLSKKIWQTNTSMVLKLFVVGLLIFLLILALVKFNGVESGEVVGRRLYISRWEIMIYSASFLIGLNWSINLLERELIRRINLPNFLKVTISTILFSVMIPITFYFLVNTLVQLNIFGGGG